MTSRPSTAAPILAVLAVILVTLGAYVGGYFCLGMRIDEPVIGYPPSYTRLHDTPASITRLYPHPWQAFAFTPLALIESRLRGVGVTTYDRQSLFRVLNTNSL
jgi:hypothetical protein